VVIIIIIIIIIIPVLLQSKNYEVILKIYDIKIVFFVKMFVSLIFMKYSKINHDN